MASKGIMGLAAAALLMSSTAGVAQSTNAARAPQPAVEAGLGDGESALGRGGRGDRGAKAGVIFFLLVFVIFIFADDLFEDDDDRSPVSP